MAVTKRIVKSGKTSASAANSEKIRNVSEPRKMRCGFYSCPRGSLIPTWVKIWLYISTILCVMDVFYTMMRPLTNRGGGWLAVFYEPWNIYADVDYRYADKSDLVTMATGRVMIVELIMNVIALFMDRRQSRHTVLTTFTTSAFVFWKTVWYMVLFIRQPPGTPVYLNPEASLLKEILVFWVADGVWVIAPFLVMVALWNRLAKNDYSDCHSMSEEEEEECTKKAFPESS